MSRTLGHLHAGHAVASSLNTISGANSVYLHLPLEDNMRTKFLSRFVEEKDLICHPALPSIILAHLEYEETDKALLEMRLELGRLEQQLGHSKSFEETQKSHNPLARSDLNVLSRAINIFASRVNSYTEHVEIALLRMDCLQGFIDMVAREMESSARWDQIAGQQQTAKLIDHLTFLRNGWRVTLARLKAFQSIAQTQLAVVRRTAPL